MPAEAAGHFLVGEHGRERAGKIRWISGLMQQARPLAVEQLGKRPVVRRDHRHPRGQRLDRRQPLRLRPRRGQGEDVDRLKEVKLRAAVDLSQPAEAIGHTEIMGKRLAGGEVVALGLDRCPCRDHLDVVPGHHHRQRPHELVEALLGTAAGEKADHKPATAAPPPRREIRRLWRKHGEIEAVRDHRDAVGRHSQPLTHRVGEGSIESHEAIDIG